MTAETQRTVVLIGNGVVGQRFCEQLVARDADQRCRLVVFSEDSRAAYDRAGLTTFFAHRSSERLMRARRHWYRAVGIQLHVGDRALEIDCHSRTVHSLRDRQIHWDTIVLATGASPIVPEIPGIRQPGVFLYREFEDFPKIAAFAHTAKSCAVLGGGFPALEAAQAAAGLGLRTCVVHPDERLIPGHLDDSGSRLLAAHLRQSGLELHSGVAAVAVSGRNSAEHVELSDGCAIPADVVIIAAGSRPRDELARDAGLAVAEQGGIMIDDDLRTSDRDVCAIGECTQHRGMVPGLVAPGYRMADALAASLCGHHVPFEPADQTALFSVLGLEIVAFGEHTAADHSTFTLAHDSPVAGVYRKLLFSSDGRQLLGGLLMGDTADYRRLLHAHAAGQDLPCAPRDVVCGRWSGTGASLGVRRRAVRRADVAGVPAGSQERQPGNPVRSENTAPAADTDAASARPYRQRPAS